MQTPVTTYLQSRAITAGSTNVMDAPLHPDKGAIIGYMLTVEATLTDPGAAPKAADWTIASLLYSSGGANSGFLETLLSAISLNAPRMGGDIVESNISGRDLALLYQLSRGRDINRTPDITTAVAGAAHTVSFSIVIPFYDPILDDPTFATIPAYLLKGDVTLKITNAALTTTIANGVAGSAGGTSTFSAVTAYWSSISIPASGNEVPVITKIKKSTYSSDTIDIGPGTPMAVADLRSPESGVITDYNVNIDGTPYIINARPRQLMAAFLETVQPSNDQEEVYYTPLLWAARNAQYTKFETSERNIGIKLNGAASATLLVRTCFRPNETVEARVAAANGIPAPGTGGVVSLPKAPSGHPSSTMRSKIAAAGPRVLLVSDGSTLNPPPATANAEPKVLAVAAQVSDTGGLSNALNKSYAKAIGNPFNVKR